MSKERLFQSLNFIDDEYIKEAEPKMKKSTGKRKPLRIAACFILLVCLGLYLFLPYGSDVTDLTAYAGSEYYPLIEKIEDYRYVPRKYNNNFESIVGSLASIGGGLMSKDEDMSGGDNMAAAPEAGLGADGSNGSYVEATDNQVAGVIEADIFKMTDKYIFRIGQKGNEILIKVYSVAKEDSTEIATYSIPEFDDQQTIDIYKYEMYLSEDCNTITLIKEYRTPSYKSKVGIVSVDVSDVNDMKTKSMVSIDGSYNSSRMVDGKLLLISEFYFNTREIDYEKPETYVPTIDRGSGKECIKFEDILIPDKVGNTRYSVVALFDEDKLDMLGAHALLNFTNSVYVSESNVYISREYSRYGKLENSNSLLRRTMSDIAVLNYESESLTSGGVITVEGAIKNQYSLDEREGYLRVVTSTSRALTETSPYSEDKYELLPSEYKQMKRRSTALSVFNVKTGELVADVKDFAPEGESAESVRFDGDKAYVCTAIVITFTDPVYFFDLSDYSNITYTDTGVIDGYSTSLINLGEGFLLGIGQENWQYNKVEVYEERDGAVVSVDVYKFDGNYSLDYKSYLVNRENNLFGFAVSGIYDKQSGKYGGTEYVLLAFNGYTLEQIVRVPLGYTDEGRVRAAYIDGYLYVTDDLDLIVTKVQ